MNQATRSIRTASLTAGCALLLMAVVAALSNFGVLERLVTPGDATRTAADIAASEPLFRAAVAGFVVVAVLDVVVAGALLTLFERVNRSISTMTAAFRVAYAAVFLVAISQLVVAAETLGEPVQALRAVDTFTVVWNAGLVLFACHLLLLGYLAYRSGFVPRVFGVLLAVAGLGYLADSLGTVLVTDYAVSVAQFTFVGEVALIFWLLVKGTRLTAPHDAAPDPEPARV